MNATAPWINTTTITTTSKQGKPTPIVNWGFAPLLIGATLLAALLSGTTLGIMSLDLTYLRVLSESGTTGERRRATAILRVRQHPNWLLCSMICAMTLVNSYIPVIRNATLPHTKDYISPAIISNLYAAFFIDILGQLLIPPRILKVAFHAMPLIYPLMGIFAIPAILPTMAIRCGRKWFGGRRAEEGILPNRSLWTFIKYHEEDENYGGRLWKETSECMRGALELQEKYAEDAMTAWADIKKIRLSDPVTPEFTERIKASACSRIIVVENVRSTPDGEAHERVVGFLHIKELLTISERYGEQTFVYNLNLYPIVIVPEDFPLLDLLKLFFSGKSRIAVVVPSRRQKLPGPIKNNLFPIYGPHQVGRSNEHQHEYRALVGREIEWTDELLESMQSSPYKQCRRFALTDIPHRKPIGIITADDIINTLVMESGRDEAGYYKGDKPKPAASMWGLDVLHEIKTMPAKKRRGLSKAVLAGAGGGGMGPAGGVAGAFAAGRLGAAGRAGVAIGGAGVAVGDP